MSEYLDTLNRLAAMLAERRHADPDASYVARLYKKGDRKIAQKVGEEAVEVAMAVAMDDQVGIINEGADLLFHLMVLLEARGLSLADLALELSRREGFSGLAEKASRLD